MSQDDVKVIKNPGTAYLFEVESRGTSGVSATIKQGEPVKLASTTTSEYLIILATGDPEQGTDQFVGIAKKESTETSALGGKVEIVTLLPMSTVLRAKATTSDNVDTAAEILALKNDWVCFDYTTAFTIDENEGTDPDAHGLMIIDGDPVEKTLDVFIHPHVISSTVAT